MPPPETSRPWERSAPASGRFAGWEKTEAELQARRIEDHRRLASGEATAAEINTANYAWPDPAGYRTAQEPLDFSCLELDLD